MKTCSKCGDSKSLESFNKCKSKKDGLYPQCKECRSLYTASSRMLRTKAQSVYNQSRKGKFKMYQTKAKERDLPFDLSYNDFISFWQEACYHCGSEIKTIGIDRMDSSIGYIKTNCVSCCTKCNIMKLDHSEDDWISHMLLILNHKNIETKRIRIDAPVEIYTKKTEEQNYNLKTLAPDNKTRSTN